MRSTAIVILLLTLLALNPVSQFATATAPVPASSVTDCSRGKATAQPAATLRPLLTWRPIRTGRPGTAMTLAPAVGPTARATWTAWRWGSGRRAAAGRGTTWPGGRVAGAGAGRLALDMRQ